MSDRAARFLLAAACLSIPFAFWAVLSSPAGSGSLYPEFSSLRSDQHGTLVFYESLARTQKFDMARNFRLLAQTHWRDASVLVIGIALNGNAQNIEKLLGDCEEIARAGNRAVIALQPAVVNSPSSLKAIAASFKKRGVNLIWNDEEQRPPKWTAVFQPNASWRILQITDGQAVAIERATGRGMLALSSSSDQFTNQGIVKRRDPALLLALVGSPRQIVFDESHLGVIETGTVLGLARHYRLQGFLGGVLVVAILFLWRSSSPFPAPRESERRARVEDPLSGFARLLERSVPKAKLLEECHRARVQVDRSAACNRLFEEFMAKQAGERDPVQSFQQLQNVLGTKRTRRA